MAEAPNASKTPTQLINIGIIIITKSTIFSTDIRKWYIQPDNEKTWPNCKDHFKAAQKEIKKGQPKITTDSLGFHPQANAATLVDQVTNRLATQRDDVDATTITEESVAEQQMQQQLHNSGPSVQVANGNTIQTTKSAVIPLASELSTQAKSGHIFNNLKSGSLISIRQLCHDDCVALFIKYDEKIYKNGQIIIVGKEKTQ
jgi:hypothetical protein